MLYCWVCPCRLCSEGEQLHVVPSGRHLTVSFLCTNFLAFLFRYKVREYRHTREFGEDEGERHIEVQGVCGVLVYCNLLDTTARKSLARAWEYEGCWELSSMVLKRKREIDDGSELRVNCLFPTSVLRTSVGDDRRGPPQTTLHLNIAFTGFMRMTEVRAPYTRRVILNDLEKR